MALRDTWIVQTSGGCRFLRPLATGSRTHCPVVGHRFGQPHEIRWRLTGPQFDGDEDMLPRQVLPRQFYLITRRCTQRQFLLRPDKATNNGFLYCLIDADRKSTRLNSSH